MISLFWWHHKLGSHPFERSIHPRSKIYHGIYREFCKLLKHQILSILFIYIYDIFSRYLLLYARYVAYTSPKTNMEPENHPTWKGKVILQISVFGFHASFRECITRVTSRWTCSMTHTKIRARSASDHRSHTAPRVKLLWWAMGMCQLIMSYLNW